MRYKVLAQGEAAFSCALVLRPRLRDLMAAFARIVVVLHAALSARLTGLLLHAFLSVAGRMCRCKNVCDRDEHRRMAFPRALLFDDGGG